MADAMPEEATEVAVLTPAGRGAIAVVAVSGPRSVKVVDTHFRSASGKSLTATPAGRIVFGRWGADTGEEVVVCRGEQSVEVHCHGGNAASRAICQSLAEAGCRRVDPSLWLEKSAEGRLQCEAQQMLGAAVTEQAALVLLDQFNGVLKHAVDDILAHFNARRLDAARCGLRELLTRWPLGERLTQPARVVLTGAPNVGKSSLINAMVGYERAIVFDQPGTTRDVVAAVTAIDGWAVELIDTAGLREADSELEQAGIQLAQATIENADLVLVVGEAADWLSKGRPATEFDQWLAGKRIFNVANKIDRLSDSQQTELAKTSNDSLVMTSATERIGVDELLKMIRRAIVPGRPTPGMAVPFAARHAQLLRDALEKLTAGETAAARQALLAMDARFES